MDDLNTTMLKGLDPEVAQALIMHDNIESIATVMIILVMLWFFTKIIIADI